MSRPSRRTSIRIRLAAIAVSLPLCQCAQFSNKTSAKSLEPSRPQYHVDEARYQALRPQDASIRINLATQTATLLDRSGEPVIITDISTGKPGHETPTGKFRITEKLPNKRSNLYGRYIDRESGADLGESWTFESRPKGAVYQGLEMPYWMRLTHDGVGIHVGHVVPRIAASFGCIRVPEMVQPLFYEKTRVGTRVEIVCGEEFTANAAAQERPDDADGV